MNVFRAKLGDNPLNEVKRTNPFTTASEHGVTGTPWGRVNEVSQSRANYVLNHLNGVGVGIERRGTFDEYCAWTRQNAECTCRVGDPDPHCAKCS